MANRQERREAAKAHGEKMSDELRLAMLAAQGDPAPQQSTAGAPIICGTLTLEQAADELGKCGDEIMRLEALNASAQREIEALQVGRAEDRETILDLRWHLENGGKQLEAMQALVSRDVAADEIDLDPRDAEAHPGGAAYDAGLKAGMLRAALICETRWASDIGRHCANSIREAEEKIT